MQLGAINQVNFQGRNTKKGEGRKSISFAELKEKAEQNVHIATVGITSVTTIAAIMKGKKYVSLATKGLATVGETAAKGAVKGTSAAINGFKKHILKKSGNINPQKSIDNIHKFADKIRNENPVENKALMKGVNSFVGNIFGQEKAGQVTGFMKKRGIVNAMGIINTTIATAIGLKLGDKTSDKIENALDKKDLAEAAKELEALETILSLS